MKQKIEINEFVILQNPIIGSHILHEFSKYYYSEKKEGIKIPFLFIVLPIVFSKEYSDDISIKNFKIGSMLKSLNNENLYWDTLQQRMSDFSEITFQSLNIAFAASLLLYDNQNGRIIPNNYKSFKPKDKKDYDKMIKTAHRLGYWFGLLKDEEICSYLNISF
mgnify:FL=1